MQPNLFFQYLPKNSFWCPRRLFEQSFYYLFSNHSLMPMLSDVAMFCLLTIFSLPFTLSSMTNFKAQSLIWIYLSISGKKVVFFCCFFFVFNSCELCFYQCISWMGKLRLNEEDSPKVTQLVSAAEQGIKRGRVLKKQTWESGRVLNHDTNVSQTLVFEVPFLRFWHFCVNILLTCCFFLKKLTSSLETLILS